MNPTIEEIIIVEGRDDASAVKNAVCAEIIVTHGYGIKEETWKLIEKAYNGPGIIILTDPDYAGEKIRKRIAERFPLAKHAYISRDEASDSGDIGVENASPESIVRSLETVRQRQQTGYDLFTMEDLLHFDLAGSNLSGIKRDKIGKVLGIGYGNAKTFLSRLNHYGITREEYFRHGKALFTGDDSEDKG